MTSRRQNGLGRLACTVSMAALISTAWAQDAPADETEDVIIVTGSNIAGASDSGTIAVTTIDKEQIDTFGQVSAGEILENLPQAGSFEINDSADGPNSARGDVATVNLRGLGSGSTLILLNGRRIAPHAVFQDVSTQGAGSVPRTITNVQAFPAAGIDRIEVLRDGASALYGSDAVAGVVNTILDSDYDGSRITLRLSGIEGTEERERKITFSSGFDFNEGDTRLFVTGSYFNRDGLFASELGPQFNNVDKRAFLESQGSPYASSTDFRNTSTRSPFGQFRVGELTPDGTFDPIVGQVCLDDGNLNSTLRFDFNAYQPVDSFGEGQEITQDSLQQRGRQTISDADRFNFFTNLEHDFANGIQGFGEFLFYRSETSSARATQPIDSGLAFILVPRTNYYNPVGAVGSPNRVDGISAPDEGLDVLVSRWRPTEHGPRIFEVDATTFRLLGGLRGEKSGWDWESAFGYSESHVSDTASNRISKTLLSEQLALSTPDAINPFGGPNANTQEQMDRVRISVTNEGKTSLATWDLRASKPDLFEGWAGAIGAAFGAEWRRESYEEDRDPRLDGTTTFSGGAGGPSDISDVVGVSPTEDSDASRNVLAMFGETIVPLMRSNDDVFINELNLQVAARAQYFTDIEDFVVKPKVALSYFPVSWLNFRGAYSQGFRAPNLVQLNRGDISRLNQGIVDFARAPATNDPSDTGETFRPTIRVSNPDLEPEESETVVFGMTVDIPFFDDMAFNVDYWKIEQENLIGTLGAEVILALDAIALQNGSSDPRVERLSLTAEDQAAFDAYNLANPDATLVPVGEARVVNDGYINLDRQETEGIDLGLKGSFDYGKYGDFRFLLEATRQLSFDLFRGDNIESTIEGAINDPQFGDIFASEFDAFSTDRMRLNGNPEWRATGTFTYRNGPFGAGSSVRYISGVEDTSVDNIDADGDGNIDFFPVDSWTRVNAYVDYRFDIGPANPFRIRLGVNNLFDKAPPLADESRGYFTSLHSVRGQEFYLQLRSDF